MPLSEALNPNLLQWHRTTLADTVKQHISLHLVSVRDNKNMLVVIISENTMKIPSGIKYIETEKYTHAFCRAMEYKYLMQNIRYS